MRSVALLGSVAAVWCATPAFAARVDISGSTGPQATGFIDYVAGAGEANRVRIRRHSTLVTIRDRGARQIRLLADARRQCERRERRVVACPDYAAFVDLRDRADRARFSPGGNWPDEPVTDPLSFLPEEGLNEGEIDVDTLFYGGRGDDVLIGGSGPDSIVPGPGRDVVRAAGGPDGVVVTPDGRRDVLRGGGDVDWFEFESRRAVTTDLAAGTGGGDRIEGFERIYGGDGADRLFGSDRAEAIFAGDGSDVVDGRGGNDLIAGDDATDLQVAPAFSNSLSGGSGDDVIDARSAAEAPTSMVDCGPGADRVASDVDDLLDPSCDASVFREQAQSLDEERLASGGRTPPRPVARDASGDPVFDLPCPREVVFLRCEGTISLERPPTASPSEPESYGSAAFTIEGGRRASIAVTLTPAGRTADLAGMPIAVRVEGERVTRIPTRSPFEYGWQAVFGP